MAWIESHQTLGQHPKTRRLARYLGISLPTAVGHLHYFWWWALDYAQDGNLSKFEPEDIAEAALWEGDAATFLEALIKAGFVDRKGQELVIHDWDDYAGRLIDKRKANRERQRKWRERVTNALVTPNESISNGATITIPNQTNTVPNQEDKSTPDTNVSGGEASSEPGGSGQGNDGASASEPILEQAIQPEQEQPALVAQNKKRKQTKPVYGEAERALVDKMRQWREEQNCPPTQKDWHLRELAIVAKLLKTYPAEELEACFLAAKEDEYWRTRLDSWATIERYLPRWRLQQSRDRPEGLRVPKAWHKLKRYFQEGDGSDEGGSGEAFGLYHSGVP